MATQQQPATSSEDGTSYSSYSGTNSYTGQSSLTSSVQIHNYNEIDENSTIDSKPAAFENGLQSLTTNSLIQQRIQQQGEVSACSTNTKEFSLPSSFGGGAGTDGSTINDTIASASSSAGGDTNDGGSSTRASASIGSRNTQQERNDLLQQQQQQQQQQMEVYNNNSSQELVSVNSSSDNLQLAQDDINNSSKEDQLTIRISKETKPMMHLLRMLKEMDTNDDTITNPSNSNNQLSINTTNNNPKNKAISSLISDFEQEVTLIEHRIKDETKIVNYDDNGDNNNNSNEQSSTSLTSSIQPLPPNWIALEDPNSGDVYYANEVTGVTQWERPGSTTNNNSNMNDSRSTFNDSRSTFNDSYNQSGSTLNDSYNQSGSLQGSNLSNNNNNYKQQSTTSTTFIGNVIQKSDILRNNSQLANSYQDSQQSNNFQDSQQSNNNMSSSYTNMSSSLNDSAFTSTTETTTSTNLDDNDDLPPDWIAIIDSDTGETYYANEVTGESTWEKPISHQQQQQQSVPQDDHDNVNSNNNDDELPLGWFAAVDEQSGDTYYCNETTGETTWDRPSSSNKEVEDVNSSDKNETGGTVDEGTNENDNRPQDDNDDNLPPGWFTAVDQDSGDTYYCNEATGETTWDKPTMSTTSIEETSDREQRAEDKSPDNDHFGSSVGDNMRRLSISGDFENSDNDLPSSTSSSVLPLGWFAAVDEQSGDTYYCNEATGETTWDLPTSPAIVEDDTISSNTNLSSNQGGGESQDGDQLPNGWFSVTDPASGDVYYCNEVTGETTWDKPTIDKATTDLLLSRTSNNVDPTVYEDDSVTSSKGY